MYLFACLDASCLTHSDASFLAHSSVLKTLVENSTRRHSRKNNVGFFFFVGRCVTPIVLNNLRVES